MDLFNKKKLTRLQAQFDELSAKYQQSITDKLDLEGLLADKNKTIEDLLDLTSMLDDELLQVAKARYQNKYLEYTDLDGATRVMKVNDIVVSNGIVFLTEDFAAELCYTLSHLRTISKITSKNAYQEYQSTHKNNQEI